MHSGVARCLKNEFVQPAVLAPAVTSVSLSVDTGKEPEYSQTVLVGCKFGDIYQLEAHFSSVHDMGSRDIIFRRLVIKEKTPKSTFYMGFGAFNPGAPLFSEDSSSYISNSIPLFSCRLVFLYFTGIGVFV